MILILLLLAANASGADSSRQFAEMKIYDAAGSPLRTPREDWAGARERVRSDPGWVAWLEAQRNEVDDWIAKRRDRTEWVAGWWHDFVSPKDGSFLTWTPDEPGRFTLSSPSDPRVELTDKLHGGWVFGFRSRHASKIEEAAALWRLTGEAKYAEWAADNLTFYAENYLKWPLQTQRNPARLMHQSLDEAVNLLKYVRAARWLEGFATEQQKALWIGKLFRPEADLLAGSLQRIHNIACWQRSAEAAVALYTGDEAVWQRAVESEFGLRNQMAKGVTADGLWLEQSLLYNNYVVSAVLPVFIEAGLAGRSAELREEMLRAQNLLLAPVYLRFPGGKLPTPADSTGAFARAPNRNAFAAAYRVFPTRIGFEAAAQQRTLATLLDPPVPAGAAPLPEVKDWHLEASRMAVLRRNGWQVFFHYGQIDRSHAQAEALNYEAYFEGIDVTHDPGTVGYGSPLHREFYTKAWAHNVPVVDGLGQEGWNPGQPLAWAPERGRVAAAQPAYRKDVRAERTLEIDGDVLRDRLKVTAGGQGPRRIGMLVHLQGKVELPPGFQPSQTSIPHSRHAQAAEFESEAALSVQIGGRAFRLKISGPARFRLTHCHTPDAPPHQRETIYCETVGEEAEFVTEWRPEG